MTLSRRSFSFASLAALLGVSRAAAAAVPEAQAAADPGQAPPIPEVAAAAGPSATVTPRLARSGKQLALTIVVRNDGPGALLVQTKLGSRPAGDHALFVQVDGGEIALERQLGEVDRREMMSRMGPMPTVVNLASGQSLEVGPVLFALPARGDRFRAKGEVYGRLADGGTLPYDVSGLSVGAKAT